MSESPRGPQLSRRYYLLGAVIGAGLGLGGFAMSSGRGVAPALQCLGAGGLCGVVLVALVRLGLRLQRNDLPPSDPSAD